MERSETLQIIPHGKHYERIELFAQPSIVTDAHTRLWIHLQETCDKLSAGLHTGVYQLTAKGTDKRIVDVGVLARSTFVGIVSHDVCSPRFKHSLVFLSPDAIFGE